MRKTQEESYYTYGYRKMKWAMEKATGKAVGRARVLRLMRKGGLLSSVRRKQYSEEVYLNRRKMKGEVPPDLLHRDFFSFEPRKIFAVDITYLFCTEGTLYLNTIIDLFNKEVVSWAVSRHPDTGLVCSAVEHLATLCTLEGAIIHSDLGTTYISWEYRQLLGKLGVRQSCGSKADCYDNAAMESFNSVLKTEGLYARFGKSNVLDRRISQQDMRERLDQFIPWYNTERPMERFKGLTPQEYREQHASGLWLANPPKGGY